MLGDIVRYIFMSLTVISIAVIVIAVLAFILYLPIGIIKAIKDSKKEDYLKQHAFAIGDNVPYQEYVTSEGILKTSKRWKILFDKNIKNYVYKRGSGDAYILDAPARMVATDIGVLRVMYYFPESNKHIDDWKHEYISFHDLSDFFNCIYDHFGKEGLQVAKDWLNANHNEVPLDTD